MSKRISTDPEGGKRRDEARAVIEANPYPAQPGAGETDCNHRGTGRLCSCHLSLAQHAAAEELGDYTLYLFGTPYRGRVKVPHYPSGVIGFEPAGGAVGFEISPEVARQRKRKVATTKTTTAAKPDAKREYDRLWRAARAKGADALAAFKTEWRASHANV